MSGGQKTKSRKSQLKIYKPGDILFQENEAANSFFIIQTGQIRLYRPKGKGFVDLAVLRAGEVIGEMAYFDDKDQRRSCSATAIVSTEVIEVSFQVFKKMMLSLNPWLKLIMTTLVNRLKAANEKVKALEPDSLGVRKQGKKSDYIFFNNKDIIKILSTLYFVIKNYGEQREKAWRVQVDRVRFFMFEVYQISEVKYEEFYNLLKSESFITLDNQEKDLPSAMFIENPEKFQEMMIFFNSQRSLDESKKLKVSSKCEKLLSGVIEQFEGKGINEERPTADISGLLDEFKKQNIVASDTDFQDAIDIGLMEEVLIGEGNRLSSIINYQKLKKILPSLRMLNAIKQVNEEKAGNHLAA